MKEFGPRIWEELHYGRPHGAVPLSVTSLTDVSGPTSLAIGFHLCLIPRPLRIAGYSFAGEGFQETNYRLWMHRANEQTGLPVGAAIAKSDTGVRLIGPGTSTATRRDSIRTPAIDDFASALVATRYVDLLLPNVVEILVPGVYWIGVNRQPAGDNAEVESYRCSTSPPLSGKKLNPCRDQTRSHRPWRHRRALACARF